MNFEEIEHVIEQNGYTIRTQIGSGGSATCYIVHSEKYNSLFVCKVMRNIAGKSSRSTRSFYAEVKALSDIIHPNIIKIYDYFSNGDVLFLVLEYCNGGSFDKIIPEGNLTMDDIRIYMKQLIDALIYIHSMNMAHHDLKPANIFIDCYNRVKLADFGLVQLVNDNYHPLSESYSGSVPYMAPEIFEKKPYDPFKADVWAFGVTLFQFVTGRLPFVGQTIHDIAVQMRECRYSLTPGLPQDITLIIKSCLVPNPQKRPTMIEIKSMFDENQPQKVNYRRRTKVKQTLSVSSFGEIFQLQKNRRRGLLSSSSLPPLKMK